MSTGLEVRRLVTEKKLFELPIRSNGSKYRVVTVGLHLEQAFMGPWDPGSDDETVMPRFKQQLDNFMLGKIVVATFRRDPKVELRRLQPLKHLKKNAVWEFRFSSKKPKEHRRLFGCFAEKDYFLGLVLKERSNINFNMAILETYAAWNKLLPGHAPIESEDINDFIKQPYHFFP